VGLRELVLAAVAASTGLANVHYGAPPPDVPLVTSAGTQRVAQLRGAVVVLDFWATWCHACLDQMTNLVKLQRAYGNRVRVITISNEPQDVAASYFRTWNIYLPLVEDTHADVFKAYSIGPLPTTVVLDPAGSVSFVAVGEATRGQLDGAIDAALAAK
jgi:thiol-disulfide isomerase/thioredoxin